MCVLDVNKTLATKYQLQVTRTSVVAYPAIFLIGNFNKNPPPRLCFDCCELIFIFVVVFILYFWGCCFIFLLLMQKCQALIFCEVNCVFIFLFKKYYLISFSFFDYTATPSPLQLHKFTKPSLPLHFYSASLDQHKFCDLTFNNFFVFIHMLIFLFM